MSPQSPARVGVAPGTSDQRVRQAAAELARELGIPLVSGDVEQGSALPGGRSGVEQRSSLPNPISQFDFLLVRGEHRLELHEIGRRGASPIFVEFASGSASYRRRSSHDRHQPLARAVGLRHGTSSVVDATAGLARDTFLLASFGCRVIAVERSPLLGALIRDGLERAAIRDDPHLRAVVQRIKLVIQDAREVLAGMSEADAPDVVYIDPMYPPKRKSALPKKDMLVLRRLVGNDFDAGELLETARAVARKRVVVKRHRRNPPLAPRPMIQYAGKLVRYDVYRPLDPQRLPGRQPGHTML